MLIKSPFEEYRLLCGEPSPLRSLVAHFIQSVKEDKDAICATQRHFVPHTLSRTGKRLILGAWWYGESQVDAHARSIACEGYRLHVDEDIGSMEIGALLHQWDQQDPEDCYIERIIAPFKDKYGLPDYSWTSPE